MSEEEKDGIKATYWRVRVGETWSVPVVELTKGEPRTTTLILSDGGRASASTLVQEQLGQGHRVLAVDPHGLGEANVNAPRKGRGYLYSLLLASVGSRPLGIQATQLIAVARLWSSRGSGPITVVADGPRTSVMALVAAALDDRSFRGTRAPWLARQSQRADREKDCLQRFARTVLLRSLARLRYRAARCDGRALTRRRRGSQSPGPRPSLADSRRSMRPWARPSTHLSR